MIMISNNLKVFVQVAEKGSFTGAANTLYISQPAVSRAVKALEDELEVKLFCRDRRNGLILTEAGKKILSLALQMEDLENRIYQTAYNENHMMGGRVRIASMPILTSVILSKVFSRFRKMYPGVNVELMEGSASEIRSAIEAHEVDFGFFCSPFGNPGIIGASSSSFLFIAACCFCRLAVSNASVPSAFTPFFPIYILYGIQCG